MVRASDCGPEGHRFNPGIPPQIYNAGIVQWLVCKFSKLEMRVQFSLPAPSVRSAYFYVVKVDNLEKVCYNGGRVV